MPEVIDVHIGSRIRKRRKDLGLNQTQLALQVGVKFQQIQNYETGRNGAPPLKLHKLARALGVPVQYFFAGFEDGGGQAQVDATKEGVQELYLRKEALDLLRSYYKLDESGRSELLKSALSLNEQQSES